MKGKDNHSLSLSLSLCTSRVRKERREKYANISNLLNTKEKKRKVGLGWLATSELFCFFLLDRNFENEALESCGSKRFTRGILLWCLSSTFPFLLYYFLFCANISGRDALYCNPI